MLKMWFVLPNLKHNRSLWEMKKPKTMLMCKKGGRVGTAQDAICATSPSHKRMRTIGNGGGINMCSSAFSAGFYFWFFTPMSSSAFSAGFSLLSFVIWGGNVFALYFFVVAVKISCSP
jgi:hypothetical protein